MKTKLSRREVVGVVGAAALLPAVAGVSARAAEAAVPSSAAPSELPSAAALLAPLAAGSRIGAWTVQRLGALHAGAFAVELRDATGQTFFLDLCARDREAGAPRPPAQTDCYDIFVANEGRGADPTNEQHGLAAMAIADIVRANEHRVQVGDVLTLRERMKLHAGAIFRGVRNREA